MPDRPLGRTDIILESESTCAVVVLEFVCRCDDITVMWGIQALAVIERRDFTHWMWNGGPLVVDDLALSIEGETVFATLNGGGRYLTPATDIRKLTDLIANSG